MMFFQISLILRVSLSGKVLLKLKFSYVMWVFLNMREGMKRPDVAVKHVLYHLNLA